MNEIIQYDERLSRGDGGFITPKNKIIFTDNHEKYAHDYCFGCGLLFNREEAFKNSKLTSEELELFKLWFKEDRTVRNMNSDFLVHILKYDKIETIMRRMITTTNPNPHVRFYNYYLMDFNIYRRRPLVYNNETASFEEVDYNELWEEDPLDRETKKEIDEIKGKVLYKDRYLYFK